MAQIREMRCYRRRALRKLTPDLVDKAAARSLPAHRGRDGEVDERFGGRGQIFEIAGEPAVSADPSEGALDDPAFDLDDKAGAVGALDNLNTPMAGAASRLADTRSLVSGISEDGRDKRKASSYRFGQDERRAVAVLDARRMDHGSQQEPLVVGEDAALNPLDLLARIEPDRIARRPPFCADLTLWLSRRAANGWLRGLPARASRHREYRGYAPACRPRPTVRNSCAPCSLWEILRQVPPRAASLQDIEQPANHGADVDFSRTTAALGRRDQRCKGRPFSIRQIAWIPQPTQLLSGRALSLRLCQI